MALNGSRWVSDGFFLSAWRLFSITSVVERWIFFYFGENAAVAAVRLVLKRDFVRAGSYDDKYAPSRWGWMVMLLILLGKNLVTELLPSDADSA